MFLKIIGTNPASNTSKYNFKSYTKTNFLPQDTFEMHKNSNLSFGSVIPKNKIFKCCDDLLKSVENFSESDDVTLQVNDFYHKKLLKLLDIKLTVSEKEKERFRSFKHTLINIVATKINYEGKVPKSELEYFVNDIKDYTESYEDSNKIVQATTIWNKLKKILKSMNSPAVSINNQNLLLDKKIKHPLQFNEFVSQPLLNAIKYSEEKPFKIIFEEVSEGDNKKYYASFINPETKPIPDEEIDEILKGDFYRSSNAKLSGIQGSGFGFWSIINTLRQNGCEHDIPNLIEKGREKGVCVRIPLIGLH
jgi:hypothetical protein